MTAVRPTPPPGSPGETLGAREHLTRVMSLFARLLRAGRGLGGELPEAAVTELRDGLRAACEGRERVAVDLSDRALLFEGGGLVTLSASDDRALTRLHRQGARRIVFERGVTTEDLRALLEVVAGEAGPGEVSEQDEATRLADSDLASVRVELAPEEPVAPGAPSGDVAAALELASLVGPAGREGAGLGPGSARSLDHPELAGLASSMVEAMDRLTPWVAGAALPLLEEAAETDRRPCPRSGSPHGLRQGAPARTSSPPSSGPCTATCAPRPSASSVTATTASPTAASESASSASSVTWPAPPSPRAGSGCAPTVPSPPP